MEVHGRVDHVVAVEHHVVHAAYLAEALDGVVHGPAAVVDQLAGLLIEPALVIPALGPVVRAVGDVGDLGVVLGDVVQQLHHDGGVVVVDALPVVLRLLLFGKYAVEHASLDAVRQVAPQLRVVAPQSQLVNGGADQRVPYNARLAVLGDARLEDALHVLEREVGRAGVSRRGLAAQFSGALGAQVGVAVDGAAVAAVHLDGVLLGHLAQVVHRLHAAIAHRVQLARLRLARVDGSVFGHTPGQTATGGPAGSLVVEFGPFLLRLRNHVVVVGADDLAQHVVGQVGYGLRVLHVHAAVALHHQRLDVLRSHHRARAGAGGVVARVDDARVRKQVLAGGADGGHARLDAFLAAQHLGGLTGAHAPHEAGVLDLHLVVDDVQVYGVVGCTLQNHGVPAGQLDLRADHAAAVGVHHEVVLRERGQRADGGAAGQGHAGSRQRSYGEDELVLGGEGVGAGGHFVVHDLVGQAHAADVLLVGVGRLRRDRARAQIDAEDLTGPSIRCFVSHVASPNLG